MDLMKLVNALILAAAEDGEAGTEEMSETTKQYRNEIRRRYDLAFRDTDDTVPASIVREILDGER